MAPPESDQPKPLPIVKDSHGNRLCDKLKEDGNRCTRRAGSGTDHRGYGRCNTHGGASPDGIMEAARQRVGEMSGFYGLPKNVHPGDVLLAETRRTAGHVEFLQHLINRWENEDEAAGPSDALEAWLRIYHMERAHLIRTSKMAIDAGVQERMVSLAEKQGAMVADVIDRILTELQLSDRQKALIPMVVPAALRSLTAGVPNHQVIELEESWKK